MNGIKLRINTLSISTKLNSPRSGVLSNSAFKFLFSACIMLVLVIGIGASDLSAQERVEVTGTVTDASDGAPLPGASIIVQGSQEATGSTIGTTTDMDGQYILRVPENMNTLVVSFIGYITQEVPIDGQTTVNIEMQPDVRMLGDVVVVGYGTQEEREITSAVATVDTEQFNRGNVNSAEQLLQGKVPGLNISTQGGDPNGSSTIRLRGLSTVGANTEPLIVIDGVSGASLDNVDPNDIESINVLKDGSAAAIYGTRGSSGVILVTTKKGYSNVGQPGQNVQLQYNGYVSASTIDRQQPVMTRSEYLAAGGNDLGGDTDWIDEVTRTGYTNVHNLSVSGGSESTVYRVSTNIRDVSGILKESGFDQVNARANITHTTLDDRLQLTLNASTTKRNFNRSFNEALRYAVLYNPTAPIRFDNGEYFQAVLFDNFNPVAIVNQNTNDGESKTMNFNVQAQFDPVDKVSVNANYARQFNSESSGEFYPSTSFFRGLNRDGLARRYFQDRDFTLFETYASYTDTFSDRINLTLTGGYSYQETFDENLTLELGNLPTNENGYYIIDLSGDRVLGNPNNVYIDSYASPDEKIIAFFGRLNMTFDNGVFLNASLRREGSTKLGPDNQWGLFPAVSVGTDLSRYVDVEGMTQFKVRLGYGVTGALPGPNGLAKDLYEYAFDAGGTVSFQRDGNPDLKWEEKSEINLGVDYGFFDDRLSGSLDLYTRNINDFILEVDVPTDQYASGRQYQNAGKLQTRGLEFLVNYDVVRDTDILWNTGIVFDTYNTTLEEYITDESMRANLGSPGQNSTNLIRVAKGEEVGQIWGPVFSGEVAEDGSPIMKDLNGDGQLITDQGNALSDDGDFKQLGSGFPDFSIGWTNQVNYKNWSLNAFFRGAFGHSLVNTYRAFYEPIDPGAINSYNRVITDKAVDGLTVAQFSSLYVEKADFFKLDNVTLSYDFDVSNLSFVRSIQVRATVQNAFTITNYTGINPEPILQDLGASDNGGRIGTTGDVLSPGIDRRHRYFSDRTFTFGVNIGF